MWWLDFVFIVGSFSFVGNELETRCRVWRRGLGVVGIYLLFYLDSGVVRALMEDFRVGVFRFVLGIVGLFFGFYG